MKKALNILEKISAAGLVGRGGASYPTAAKWAAVKSALSHKKIGYIIANGAEGEPGVKKDAYILNNHAVEVINGLFLADHFLGSAKIKKIYIFLRPEYHKNYGAKLKAVLAGRKYQAIAKKIEFFLKPERLSYISGEETALLNLIEGKRVQPRLKPPYPTTAGLHGHPTLINNIETLYNVSLVGNDRYQENRFYTINGAVHRPGVHELPASLTVADVLRRTDNLPREAFFVQVGGEASGEILNSGQLDRPVEGAGSIMVYDFKRTDKNKLVKYWLKFYKDQSCGKCSICREGTYHLAEMINKRPFDHKLFWKIIDSLEQSSFCALGASLAQPLKSYFDNISRS